MVAPAHAASNTDNARTFCDGAPIAESPCIYTALRPYCHSYSTPLLYYMNGMSHQEHKESITNQIIALLAKLCPREAMQIEPLRHAVLNFIEHSDISVHNEITTRLSSDGRPSKRRKKDNPTSGLERRDGTLCKQAKAKPETLLFERALQTLLQGCEESSGKYEALLSELGDGHSLPLESNFTENTNRQQLAVRHYQWCEQTSLTFEGLRRLDLLCILYEIDRLQHSAERKATSTVYTESDVAAAQRKFAELSGSQVKSIHEMRKRARPYAEWALRENGLGILLMLGNQTRTLWEHDLTNESISRVWKLCSSKHLQVVDAARTLQPVACKLLERRFAALGSTAELREDGHIFSRHFKQRTGLDALAVAANQVQAAPIGTVVRSVDPISDADFAPDACAELGVSCSGNGMGSSDGLLHQTETPSQPSEAAVDGAPQASEHHVQQAFDQPSQGTIPTQWTSGTSSSNVWGADSNEAGRVQSIVSLPQLFDVHDFELARYGGSVFDVHDFDGTELLCAAPQSYLPPW